MPFFTQASVNLADDEDLLGDEEAGFTAVFVGIETPEETVLLEANKKHNVGRDLRADVRRIQRAGLQVQAGFIVGFDSDTPSVFERHRSSSSRPASSRPWWACCRRRPAPVSRAPRARGAAHGPDQRRQRGWDDQHPASHGTRRPALGLSVAGGGPLFPGDLLRAREEFLRVYEPPAVRVPVTLEAVRGFFRTLYVLGVKERGRRQFWRLTGWVLTHRPRLFPLALKESVFGLHFRRVCRRETT